MPTEDDQGGVSPGLRRPLRHSHVYRAERGGLLPVARHIFSFSSAQSALSEHTVARTLRR